MTDREVGKLIKSRRIELKISMERVAEQCGVSKSTISRWESGDIATIKRSHIYMLSKCLYIPIDTLLGDDTNAKLDDASLIIAKNKAKERVDAINELPLLQQIDDYIAFLTRKN